MSVGEMLRELEHLGVTLWEEDGQLRFRAPKGVLTDERKAALASHKQAVLAHLRTDSELVTAHPESRHEPFPLTDVQSAYVLGRRPGFLFGGVGCHAYGELALDDLDPNRLETAWQELIQRHDMLRAVILPDGTQQVLSEVADYQIRVSDLRDLESEEVERSLAATRAEMDHRVYDPGEWPLFDLRTSLTPSRGILHFSIDFLIADYGSIFILLDELRQRYEQPENELPELSISFRDCWMARRGQRSGAAWERDRAYWLERADDFPAAPELPVVEQLADDPSEVRFRRFELTLDEEAWSSLARHAREHGLTPSAAVLSAYAEVIGRFSRRQRFALDLTLQDRPDLHPDIGHIVGDFTSVNLLEVDHRRAAPFVDRARALQEQLGIDLEHSLFSGVEWIRELARRRGNREALMPVVYTSAVGLAKDGGEMPLGELLEGGISQTPQVWIDCQVMERAQRLAINWDVREGVFPGALIETMFRGFETLLRELAATPEVWSQTSPVRLPPEQITRRTARIRTRALPDTSLVAVALDQARRDPNRPCVLTHDTAFTYGEIFHRAGAVQAMLLEAGVRPGELVAVLNDKGPMQVVSVLGTLLAGAAFLPVGAKEPRLRRDQMLADGNVRIALVDRPLDLPSEIHRIVPGSLEPAKSLPQPVPVDVDGLAYVIYTSGSTGRPKGVMISHRSAANTVRDINHLCGVGPLDRVLGVSNLTFDLSIFDLFGMLEAGGAIVLPEEERRTDPSHWAELIAQNRVTVWNSVPGLMGMLQDYLEARDDHDLSSLRLVLLSGDKIPVELVRRLRTELTGAELLALGGATEGSIWSIFYPLSELADDALAVPYGRPLTNQTMDVLDQALRPCPTGVVGEIAIGGAGVAIGYLGAEDLTRERFVDAGEEIGRVYRTGDLGRYRPDGDLEILGREDNQVKIRGHRVELGEIEAALLAHSDVDRAVVAAFGSGTEPRRLRAFVEATSISASTPPPELATKAVAAAAALAVEGAEEYLEVARALDHAALTSMMDTFRQSGLFTDRQSQTSDQVVEALAAAPRYHRLVRRWLHAATGHGLLEHDPVVGCYRATPSGLDIDPVAAWDVVKALPNQDEAVLLEYFETSASGLPAILRGDRGALDLLFPQGTTAVTTSLYEHSFLNRWGHAAAAEMVQVLTQSKDQKTCLRVLEVGGGIGGTTSSLLDALREPFEYLFTDVSRFFLEAARDRFAEAPLQVALYDLNASFWEQGLTANSFDLIVAGDVLHVVRDVPNVLSQLRELLAPGGWLVALEMTRDHAQIMTSLELLNVTQDTGPTYTDEREGKDQTFFSREQWSSLLLASGADSLVSFPSSDSSLADLGLCVFAARYKADRATLDSIELESFLQDRLPRHMVPAEIQVLDHIPLTANGKVDLRLLATRGERDTAPAAPMESFTSDLERRLAEIWGRVLGLEAVPRDVDFFAAGGDSLLAAQLAGHMIEELPETGDHFFDDLLRVILDGPTLAELTQAAASGKTEEEVELESELESEPEKSPLLPLGGELGSDVCVLIHNDLAGRPELTQALAARFRLFGLRIEASDTSWPQLAARYDGLCRDAGLEIVHLVGSGTGTLLAIEWGRQLFDTGKNPQVTVISQGGIEAQPSALDGQVQLFAGDLQLVCRPEDEEAETFWRSVCLGDLQVLRAETTEPERTAQWIAEAGAG